MYHGQFELDRFLNEQYIKNEKGGFFVECGAYDGIEESTCLFFEKELEWTGINIEPSDLIFPKLFENRPRSINIHGALYNRNCIKEFSHVIHPEKGVNFGNGSLKHNKKHYDLLKEMGCKFVLLSSIECFTFKTLFEYFCKYIPNIDLFVLDVEGGELEALDGILIMDKNFLPKIFCIEHEIIGFNNINNKVKEYYNFSQQYYGNSIFIRKF